MKKISVCGFCVMYTKKHIKNMYLRIDKETGIVKVTCPFYVSEKRVVEFVGSKSDWITDHLPEEKEKFIFEDGQKICLFGKEYVFRNEIGKNNIVICGEDLILYSPSESDIKTKTVILENYYRTVLESALKMLFDKYSEKMNIAPNEWKIRKMKSRWGSCDVVNKKILIALRLAEKDIECIDCVVLHEMCHLIEKRHNRRFYDLMTLYSPEWKKYSDMLK